MFRSLKRFSPCYDAWGRVQMQRCYSSSLTHTYFFAETSFPPRSYHELQIILHDNAKGIPLPFVENSKSRADLESSTSPSCYTATDFSHCGLVHVEVEIICNLKYLARETRLCARSVTFIFLAFFFPFSLPPMKRTILRKSRRHEQRERRIFWMSQREFSLGRRYTRHETTARILSHT